MLLVNMAMLLAGMNVRPYEIFAKKLLEQVDRDERADSPEPSSLEPPTRQPLPPRTLSPWADQLQPHLDRCVHFVKRAPRRAACIALLTRMLIAHMRIIAEKRVAIKKYLSTLPPDKPSVTIVTTAALPWKTGTAVNALLRAACERTRPARTRTRAARTQTVAPFCVFKAQPTRRVRVFLALMVADLANAGHAVTLCLPWVHPEEQAAVFPGKSFATPVEQEQWMREWLAARDGQSSSFRITWYPARYDHVRGSILPLGDTTKWLGENRDLCVLEEPEHLNWCAAAGPYSVSPSKRLRACHACLRRTAQHLSQRRVCQDARRRELTRAAAAAPPPRRLNAFAFCRLPTVSAGFSSSWLDLSQVPRRSQLAAAIQAGRRRGAHQLHFLREALSARERAHTQLGLRL